MLAVVLLILMVGFLVYLGVNYIRSTRKNSEIINFFEIERKK